MERTEYYAPIFNMDTADTVLEDANALPPHWRKVWNHMIDGRLGRKSYSRWTDADVIFARQSYDVLQSARNAG